MRNTVVALSAFLALGCLEPVEMVPMDAVPVDSADEEVGSGGPLDGGVPSSPDGLVAEWAFSELMAGILVDSERGTCGEACRALAVGFGESPFRGAGNGSGLWPDESADGGRTLQLDGNDDHLRVKTDGVLLVGWKAFTITARLRLRPWSAGGESAVLGIWGEGPTDERVIVFEIDQERRPRLRLADGGFTLTAKGALSRDEWHSVTVTYDGAGLACLFIDGEPDSCVDAPVSAVPASKLPVLIGGIRAGGRGVSHHMLTGDLDVVRIYERALGADQVQKDATALASPTGAPPVEAAPCAAFAAGCRVGSPESFKEYAGIAGCPHPGLPDGWEDDLDTVACADGYRVCTLDDLLRLTPNRALPVSPGQSYALSQNACMGDVWARWETNTGYPDAGGGCGWQDNSCGVAGDGKGARVGVIAEDPSCSGYVFAAGGRSVRSGHAAIEVGGVLCCALACVSER